MSETSETVSATPWFIDEEKSVAEVSLDGQNDTIINHGSTMWYEVFYAEPGATMTVDDWEIGLRPGMTVRVEQGTPYTDQGRLEMIATAMPPFDPETVEIIE